MEMTVAGTAQDLHLIPFSCTGGTAGTSPNRLQRYKKETNYPNFWENNLHPCLYGMMKQSDS